MIAHSFSAGTVQRLGIILKIKYKKDTEVTLSDMKEVTKIRKKLFGEESYCSLIDLSQDNLTMSSEARKYVTDSPIIRKLRIAEVLLVKNFAQKIGVHTYVRISRWKDNITVMTVKDEENAIHWLERQYRKHQEKELSSAEK
ncbi:MAG: hypothetical protein WDZ35_01290 [Crocinitomicaceae bacterium]